MSKYIEIGKRLRRLRAHLSQKKFAEKLEIPYRTYQNLEYGLHMPKGDVLHRIASTFYMPIDWILYGEVGRVKTDDEMGEDIRRRLWIEGEKPTDDDIERLLKDQKEESKKTQKKIDILTVTENSVYYIMYKQLERITDEGDKDKVQAIKIILKSLDPGEKKVSSSSKKATKK